MCFCTVRGNGNGGQQKLRNRISQEGIFQISSDTEHSQAMNKKAVIGKLENLLKRKHVAKKINVP